ncbi:MAG: N-acetylglucosamine-6-phosphate deacetylase [Tannerella sp.]|jgi:N-acetylglucosamine-6-phosphate deacetylase|nr:N-acetylglucosamine-6-phosphate deacetylase [Tannerella sp.]
MAYINIINGRIIAPSGIIEGGSLLIRDGKIADVSHTPLLIEAAQQIDAGGCYVAAGGIDIHVHGGGGRDFIEATPEAFLAVAEAHARYGTTAILPTIAAQPVKVFEQAIHSCETVRNEPRQGARILGLHLEGNYLNPVMRGGQEADYLSLPDKAEYVRLLDSTGVIKRWTAAPELTGALDFGRYAAERGVIVSLGHTTAGYEMVKTASEAGYSHVTHFYNAMTGVHREGMFKHEGTIEAVYLTDSLTVELVADGIHVPPAILKMVYKYIGAERIALVTDAMMAAAYDGEASMYGGRVILENGVCILADHSAISGSIATVSRAIRTMTHLAGVPLPDAVRMASETPARILGISDRKGTLAKGKDADIIIFDDNICIKTTIIEGSVVYRTT